MGVRKVRFSNYSMWMTNLDWITFRYVVFMIIIHHFNFNKSKEKYRLISEKANCNTEN